MLVRCKCLILVVWLWIAIGKIMIILSFIVMFLIMGKNKNIVGTFGGVVCSIQLIFLVGSIFPIERALKRAFDVHGNRKE